MEAPSRAAGIDFIREFAAAAEWFAGHVARTGTRTDIPTCPGWTLYDLVRHLGNVHSWAATVVETGRATRELEDEPASHRSGRVAEWYLAKAEDLYAVLRSADPDARCWNFAFGEGTTTFWQRRQTHETLLHGVDLALAARYPERLPAVLAADGIDETLTVFLHRMHARGHRADLTHPLVLRAADADRAWTVHPAPRGAVPSQRSEPVVLDGEAGLGEGPAVEPDLVEAPAALLLKVLWKRADPRDAALLTKGDATRIGRFLSSRLTA